MYRHWRRCNVALIWNAICLSATMCWPGSLVDTWCIRLVIIISNYPYTMCLLTVVLFPVVSTLSIIGAQAAMPLETAISKWFDLKAAYNAEARVLNRRINHDCVLEIYLCVEGRVLYAPTIQVNEVFINQHHQGWAHVLKLTRFCWGIRTCKLSFTEWLRLCFETENNFSIQNFVNAISSWPWRSRV